MLDQCLRFTRNIELVPLLFKAICFIGLSWQLFEITSEYFKYKVNRQTTVFIPNIVEDLSMVMCLPVAFAIDFKKFNSEFRSNWTQKEFSHNGMLQNLSVHEIYNYTYDADNILLDLFYLDGVWNGRPQSTRFSSIMKMEKYFFRWNICYLYSVKSFKSLSLDQIKGGSVVHIFFGNRVPETDEVWLFIVEKDRISFRETIEARSIFRGDYRKLNTFETSHYSIREQLLPPPFETSCFYYSKLNIANNIECIEQCIFLKSFKKWGEIPSESFVPNNAVDYKFLKVSNYTKYFAEIDEIRLSCRLSCPNITCDDTKIVTIHEKEAHYKYSTKVSIRWTRKTSLFPSAAISCRPSSTLPELILYMMSSFSTWTGLSVMSLNPILLLHNLSKIKSVPGILTLKLRRHRRITPRNLTDRMSPLEDCVVPQSLLIHELGQVAFRPVNNRSRSACY